MNRPNRADAALPLHCLVLYKGRPARLLALTGKKLTIHTAEGDQFSVRPKDVTLLHPGPLDSLADLAPREGEVQVAWELLAGQETDLAELADLIYGEFTPASAWATWQLVEDGLYFKGEPQAIAISSPEEVAATIASREAREAERAAWEAFAARVAARDVAPEDVRYLEDVVDLALGRRDQSRVLRDLSLPETAEGAHALLLELDVWDETVNPHPHRLQLDLSAPTADLAPLPAEDRLDLTHLTALAIDDAGSQDPDDALSLDEGTLWVHVADAAARVPPDSPADRVARARAANLYLPEGTISMLPAVATDSLALGLSEVSPALSFALSLTASGEVEDLQIHPTWVRVTRLSYEQADARLEEPLLAGLFAIAQRARRRRLANGAIDIDLPEVKVLFEDGEVTMRPLPALRSRSLVQEAMLLVGEAVAGYGQAHGIPLVYSTQDAPADLDVPPGMAGMLARRKSLRRSQRTGEPGSHAGLGLAAYVQATSPLRRYLDLVVHQQLRAHLTGVPTLGRSELLGRVGMAEAVTGALRAAERLSVAHWTLVYLLQHPDWEGEGVVVEMNGARSTIIIPELAWEFSAYLRETVDLNSPVQCRLQSVNLPTLEAHFAVSTL